MGNICRVIIPCQEEPSAEVLNKFLEIPAVKRCGKGWCIYSNGTLFIYSINEVSNVIKKAKELGMKPKYWQDLDAYGMKYFEIALEPSSELQYVTTNRPAYCFVTSLAEAILVYENNAFIFNFVDKAAKVVSTKYVLDAANKIDFHSDLSSWERYIADEDYFDYQAGLLG